MCKWHLSTLRWIGWKDRSWFFFPLKICQNTTNFQHAPTWRKITILTEQAAKTVTGDKFARWTRNGRRISCRGWHARVGVTLPIKAICHPSIRISLRDKGELRFLPALKFQIAVLRRKGRSERPKRDATACVYNACSQSEKLSGSGNRLSWSSAISFVLLFIHIYPCIRSVSIQFDYQSESPIRRSSFRNSPLYTYIWKLCRFEIALSQKSILFISIKLMDERADVSCIFY